MQPIKTKVKALTNWGNSWERMAYYQKPKFVRQPMSNCYNGCMVNNNNTKIDKKGLFSLTLVKSVLNYL